jgi:type II secretory pathway component PulK
MLGRVDELRAQAAEAANTQAARNRVNRMDMQSLFRQSDPATDPWREPAELVPPTYTLGDLPITLELRDTGAGLNPNQADENMLRQFLAEGLRIDFNQADKLAQAILDFRDQDDIPRVNGGEREEYIEEGLPVLPANRDFAEVAELRHVLGMTTELFDEIRPYLTMVSSGRININAAPEPVLLALPGFTPAGATAVLRARQSGTLARNVTELRALLPSSAQAELTRYQQQFTRRVAYTTDEVEINAEVDLPGSPISARARVVVARGASGAVVVWRKVD